VSKRFERGIWWIKRDFRLRDNDALQRALEQCRFVTPLFIIEPSLCEAAETSLFHYNAWEQAAQGLSMQINAAGGQLEIACGEVVDVLERIRSRDGFDVLYSHEETGSDITFQRDKAVAHWASAHSIDWQQLHQNGVIRGLKDRDKRQPVIRQRLMQTAPVAAPQRIASWPIQSLEPARVEHWPAFETLSGRKADERIDLAQTQPVDEHQAQADWDSFLNERGQRYSGGISSPNTAFEAGSRLSAHLAWGTISLRRVFHETWQRDRELSQSADPAAAQWRKSLKAFQSRLHWHDHFIQRLESAPQMEFDALNPAYRDVDYADDEALLQAWQTGQTGLPIVDACMRCLATTGFLNFRMRAMVVSCVSIARTNSS